MNEHGENHKLLAAILCAALYPNIVKVLTPAKTFAPSVVGCIPRQVRAEEMSFKTKQDGYVSKVFWSLALLLQQHRLVLISSECAFLRLTFIHLPSITVLATTLVRI